MSHFAKVRDGRVIRVLVAEKEFFDTFMDDSPGEWIQTSYNTRGSVHYKPNSNEPSEDQSKALRANYATVGGYYDYQHDVFYPECPHKGWVLNRNNWAWEAPTPKPPDDETAPYGYTWDEDLLIWRPAVVLVN